MACLSSPSSSSLVILLAIFFATAASLPTGYWPAAGKFPFVDPEWDDLNNVGRSVLDVVNKQRAPDKQLVFRSVISVGSPKSLARNSLFRMKLAVATRPDSNGDTYYAHCTVDVGLNIPDGSYAVKRALLVVQPYPDPQL
ncbi:hypothetical protein AXF42_Ash014943 [Apostasia shenzhenica]|uniref:Cystatin domain-containing protein n=1 Tax=Apostasia shenzhenica TaxID=1088818 RepID=A0A2I0ALL8_9ASPA|nr:hypothetical protein AXF42_Ash014943 [Apostasia shenzhenica]